MGKYSRHFFLCITLMMGLVLFGNSIEKVVYPYPHGELIESYAAAADVDPLLVAAIIYVESGFNTRAVSSKGARGLMQLMPKTAIWLAEEIGEQGFELEKLFDAETNIMLGTFYLSSLLRQFGSLPVALAAYNGGRGNVKIWLTEKHWTGLRADVAQIPFAETRHYVEKVMRIHEKYQEIWRTKSCSGGNEEANEEQL
ncbi:MAG: lytic transglycosylase domain-containing protein [bacterium]|nr:lytic transglycosylase domain-containing protein [bacterium]